MVSGALPGVPCKAAGKANLKPNRLFGFLSLTLFCLLPVEGRVWLAWLDLTVLFQLLVRYCAATWGEPAAMVKGSGLTGSGGYWGLTAECWKLGLR